jgi:hypothetical protein
MLIAISCIFKLLNADTIISTLSSYVAYTAISFLPGFVLAASPVGALTKASTEDILT